MLHLFLNPTIFVRPTQIKPELLSGEPSTESPHGQLERPLFSGTLRRNLDPFSQHDDATLNDALRSSGLFSLQADWDEARLTLDSDIASGGNNLSVGQRQIIALARAIVRNNKLLILDEGERFIESLSPNLFYY